MLVYLYKLYSPLSGHRSETQFFQFPCTVELTSRCSISYLLYIILYSGKHLECWYLFSRSHSKPEDFKLGTHSEWLLDGHWVLQ